jgi:hypothetical protein
MMPDIDPMMPDIDLREERKKKRARAGICVIAGPMTVLMLIQPGWKWVPVMGVIAITAICAIAVSGDLPGGRRGSSGLSGHDRDDDGGPAGVAARMMPDIEPREERVKKRARAGICIAMGAMTVLLLIRPGWTWVTPAGVIAFSVISAIARTGELPGGRGRGSGVSGHGRDDDGGPAGEAAHRWHMLVMVSRLMPRPAGRRLLAEAESLLSEIAPARRGAAIRSYLLSAPRLVVMMWAREVQRRARLGPN